MASFEETHYLRQGDIAQHPDLMIQIDISKVMVRYKGGGVNIA